MTARGQHRGHDMHYDDAAETWRYSADDVPVPSDSDRICGYCRVPTPLSGHDPCIQDLPGVMNACCGHGVRSESYIQFEGGEAVRGFLIDSRDGPSPDIEDNADE